MTTETEPARRYAGVWKKLLEGWAQFPPHGKPVIVKVRNSTLLKRVRKAIWKEKDLDLKNRILFILHCEMDKKESTLTFTLESKPTEEDV